MDEESLEEIKSIYDLVIEVGTYAVSNIKTTEAVKLVENSQRGINIAFMNELAMVFDRMGIDTNEVVDALGFRQDLLEGIVLVLIHIISLTKQRNKCIRVSICMSTNGILLDEHMCKDILEIFSKLDKGIFYVSFHTKKSVENWYKFLKLYNTYNIKNFMFAGQVLEHNKEEAHQWMREIGIDDPYIEPNIRHISSHSWAGNVSGWRKEYNDIEVENRIRNCYYLRQRKVAVIWDESIKACCYDSDATQKCGSIFEFERADINPMGYELCRCCDPDWTTGYQ